jgi:hypothetical protein
MVAAAGVSGHVAGGASAGQFAGDGGHTSADSSVRRRLGGTGGESSGSSGSTNRASPEDDAGPRDTSDASCDVTATSTANQPSYLGDWSAGDYPSDFSDGNYLTISGVTGQMGNERQYGVHVPSGYSKDKPVPALFCIHGSGQNAAMFCLDTGVSWPAKAELEDFVVIMPNGYMNSWNAGECCGDAVSAGLDDVSLMRAIFAEVSKHVNHV